MPCVIRSRRAEHTVGRKIFRCSIPVAAARHLHHVSLAHPDPPCRSFPYMAKLPCWAARYVDEAAVVIVMSTRRGPRRSAWHGDPRRRQPTSASARAPTCRTARSCTSRMKVPYTRPGGCRDDRRRRHHRPWRDHPRRTIEDACRSAWAPPVLDGVVSGSTLRRRGRGRLGRARSWVKVSSGSAPARPARSMSERESSSSTTRRALREAQGPLLSDARSAMRVAVTSLHVGVALPS